MGMPKWWTSLKDAQGWKRIGSNSPAIGLTVWVKGDDFMGDWFCKAKVCQRFSRHGKPNGVKFKNEEGEILDDRPDYWLELEAIKI